MTFIHSIKLMPHSISFGLCCAAYSIHLVQTIMAVHPLVVLRRPRIRSDAFSGQFGFRLAVRRRSHLSTAILAPAQEEPDGSNNDAQSNNNCCDGDPRRRTR